VCVLCVLCGAGGRERVCGCVGALLSLSRARALSLSRLCHLLACGLANSACFFFFGTALALTYDVCVCSAALRAGMHNDALEIG
jgi:hypothetical protein